MKRLSNPFKFKAIETKYNGYRFRSRLEARWAVFFDTLNIRYEYEKEGFDLGGVWYLPDFWLPDHNCWIEIKGEEPTKDELYKAQLLSIYTGKETYIFYGNIGLPENGDTEQIWGIYPPSIQLVHYDKNTEGDVIGREVRDISIPPEIMFLFQKLNDAYIRPLTSSNFLILSQEILFCHGCEELDEFIEKMQKQREIIAEIAPLIRHYEKEMKEALNQETDGWGIDFSPQSDVDGLEWFECPKCGAIQIATYYMDHVKCSHGENNELQNDTPRLIAAYTAAREARFDGKR